MKKNWFVALFCVLLIGVGLYMPKQALAKAAIHVDAEIGINNRIKIDMPTVLNLTVTNNGDAFSGDLVVDAEVQYNIGSALVYPVDIAMGETKTFTIYLDGFSDRFMYSGQTVQDMFHFYEGGIEKGKKLDYEGDHYVSPRIFNPMAEMMMVVSTRKDEVSKIDRIKLFFSEELDILYVEQKNSPYLAEDYRALQMLDTIVFDDIAVQDLSQKQQEALYQWVQHGGQVMFTSNAFAQNGAGVFKEHLPLQFTGKDVTLLQDDIKQYTQTGSVDASVDVQEASTVQGATSTVKIGETVLAAKKSIGRGDVVQVAYPLHDPQLTELSGYGRLLVDSLQININPSYQNYSQPAYGKANHWSHVNELFETFKLNSWLLIAGIIVYMLLIGPVLYMVLKRKDKREKMWLYVPIIAIVTSLLFFAFGARDRILKPQIQQMALFEVSEDGTLIGSYSNALLSNRSGDFDYQVPNGTTAIAAGSSDLNAVSLHLKSYVKETADGKMLTLRDMNYWSVQSIIGETTIEAGGKLITDLKIENLKLTGTITNELPVDLHGLRVLTANEVIELGAVNAGDTINVDVAVKRQFMSQPYSQANYYGYNNTTTIDLIEQRKQTLQEAAINTNVSHFGPLLIGWSDVSLVPVTLKSGSTQSTLSYFVKPFQPEVVMAEQLTMTNEDALPQLEAKDGNSWGHIENIASNTAYIAEGTFQLTYDYSIAENLKSVNWTELAVAYDDNVYNLGLVNVKTGEIDMLEQGKQTITENVQDYINDNHVLIFELSRIGREDGSSINLPTFTLKGAPQQ